MMARREVLDQVGLFDEALSLSYDVEWLARAKDLEVGAGRLDEVCLRYRIHRGNTSADRRAVSVTLLRLLRESLHRRREQLVTE